jgi:AcrR family transcriptional regulator
MNQIAIGGLNAVAEADRPNQRSQAKRRTREKILAAARALFAERGYEASTIRDIAKAAGMSTGAVFASFADKSDLFTEIAEAEQADLRQAMRLAVGELTGKAAILAMLHAATEHQAGSFALVRAVMSALWTPGLAEQASRRLDRRPIAPLIVAAVQQELGADAGVDATFVGEMIWDDYLATLRRAQLSGLTVDVVKARVEAGVLTILAGAQRH